MNNVSKSLLVHSMRIVISPNSSGIPASAGISPYDASDEPGLDAVMSKTTHRFHGIFDTGASKTVISCNLASQLALKTIDRIPVQTANGEAEQNVHAVNVVLGDDTRNAIVFPGRRVTAAPLCGIDLLIGMDIISCGDFIISNRHGFLVVEFNFYTPVNPVSEKNVPQSLA